MLLLAALIAAAGAVGALVVLTRTREPSGRRQAGPTSTRSPSPAGSTPRTDGPDAVDAACRGTLVESDGPKISDDEIDEPSGVETSVANPDILWVHNDSGDSARVFAVSATTGDTVRAYTLAGVDAVDFEDIAIGPGSDPATTFLYLADIGDNDEVRSEVTIYRVPEPTVTAGPPVELAGAEHLTFRYPDGPTNAEALIVDPLADEFVIVTKTAEGGPAEIYSAPVSPVGGNARTLTLRGTLDLPAGSDHRVTAGDASVDGTALTVRTHAEVLLWGRPSDAPIPDILRSEPCHGPVNHESKSEAIAFTPDGRGYVTFDQKRHPRVHRFGTH